jgi:hypothetical protein
MGNVPEWEKARVALEAEQARRLRALAKWMVREAVRYEDHYGRQLLDFHHPDQFSEMMMGIAEDAGNSINVLEQMADKLVLVSGPI